MLRLSPENKQYYVKPAVCHRQMNVFVDLANEDQEAKQFSLLECKHIMTAGLNSSLSLNKTLASASKIEPSQPVAQELPTASKILQSSSLVLPSIKKHNKFLSRLKTQGSRMIRQGSRMIRQESRIKQESRMIKQSTRMIKQSTRVKTQGQYKQQINANAPRYNNSYRIRGQKPSNVSELSQLRSIFKIQDIDRVNPELENKIVKFKAMGLNLNPVLHNVVYAGHIRIPTVHNDYHSSKTNAGYSRNKQGGIYPK